MNLATSQTDAPPALRGAWADVADVTAIIPAAGRVSEGLLPMAGKLSAAMVPVAGKPVIYWTIRYLRSLGIRRFVMAVRERGQFLEDFVTSSFRDLEIAWVVPDRDQGLGYTLHCAAAAARTGKALVVLGDTFFTFSQHWYAGAADRQDPPRGSFILTAPVAESHRWCMVESEGGFAKTFVDKPAQCPPEFRAAVGVYGFDDAAHLRTCLERLVAERPPSKPIEMSAVLRAYLQDVPLAIDAPGEWLDCGNADNLARSHQKMLQQRAFNEVAIDADLGIFTKRSAHTGKFVDEINYYKLLPPKIAVLFPRLIESSVEAGNEFLSLEYYGYSTLAEVWLYDNLHPRLWQQTFSHLLKILRGPLAAYRQKISERCYQQMYVEKTVERIGQIDRRSELGQLVHREGNLVVGGVTCPTWKEAVAHTENLLRALASDDKQAVIHGDMCFSNVLYDLRARICKFIDPRGSFGQAGIYGDQKYDVAKLYHSLHGLYDFIVNDLFEVRVHGRQVELEVFCRDEHREVQRIFGEVFFPIFDQKQITLIAGLLFLSMPALHYDNPKRQVAMYVTGLKLVAESMA